MPDRRHVAEGDVGEEERKEGSDPRERVRLGNADAVYAFYPEYFRNAEEKNAVYREQENGSG